MFFKELVALTFCDNKPKSNNCQPLREAESHLLVESTALWGSSTFLFCGGLGFGVFLYIQVWTGFPEPRNKLQLVSCHWASNGRAGNPPGWGVTWFFFPLLCFLFLMSKHRSKIMNYNYSNNNNSNSNNVWCCQLTCT